MQDRWKYLFDCQDFSYIEDVMFVDYDAAGIEPDSEDIHGLVVHEDVSEDLIICKLKLSDDEDLEGETIINLDDLHS